MKSLLCIVLAGVCAGLSAFAAQDAPVAPRANSAKAGGPRRHFKRKPTGGLLLREAPKSVILIRDRQSVFTAGQVDAAVSRISRALNLPVCRIDAQAQRADGRVEVVLVDELQPTGPAKTVLAAPEQGWATLATKWLIADSATEEVRNRRLYLEIMRTIGMATGAGISMYQPCVMTLVKGIQDLDAIRLDVPGPEGINNIEKGTGSFGIERLKMTTYRMACREGWAPQPTNDVQKAIWDEIHAMPTAPIKIKPETKKVTE